jgi:hypothetical protein
VVAESRIARASTVRTVVHNHDLLERAYQAERPTTTAAPSPPCTADVRPIAEWNSHRTHNTLPDDRQAGCRAVEVLHAYSHS